MNRFLPRVCASSLLGLGGLCVGGGSVQLKLAFVDDALGDLRSLGAAAMMAAGLLLGVTGALLLVDSARWSAWPFIQRRGFWRWLAAGMLTSFFTLGLVFPNHMEARFLCRGLCALWLAALTVPLALPLRFRDPLQHWATSRAGRLLDLCAGNLVLVFLLAELALRAATLGGLAPDFLSAQPAGFRLQPGSYPHGLLANSLGFADEEFVIARTPGVPRIAFLGDSFSVGASVAFEENYVTRVERQLEGAEIFNFGVCGTGPREYAVLLSSLVWNYNPDLIIVPIFIGNDITEWIVEPELLRFQPAALRVAQLCRRGYSLLRERWRMAEERTGHGDLAAVAPHFSERTYINLAAGRLSVCRTSESGASRRNWSNVFVALEQMLADCRAHRVPIAFLLLPDELQVSPALRRRLLAQRDWEEHQIDIQLPQRRLAAFCALQEVPCLDLLPHLDPAGPDAYLPNDSHWNARGHELAACAVTPWLRSQFPALLHSPTAPPRTIALSRSTP